MDRPDPEPVAEDQEPATAPEVTQDEPGAPSAAENPPEGPDAAHRTVETEVQLAGEPRTGEVVVGEFPGSIDRVETADGAPFEEVALEEVAVGVTRIRVTSSTLPEGPVAVRLSIVV